MQFDISSIVRPHFNLQADAQLSGAPHRCAQVVQCCMWCVVPHQSRFTAHLLPSGAAKASVNSL